jgi:hypothetical protein
VAERTDWYKDSSTWEAVMKRLARKLLNTVCLWGALVWICFENEEDF